MGAMRAFAQLFCVVLLMGCGPVIAENPFRSLSPINGPVTLYLTPSVTSTCKYYGGTDENSMSLQASMIFDISLDQFGNKRLGLQKDQEMAFAVEVSPSGKELKSKLFV